MAISVTKSFIAGRQVRPYAMDAVNAQTVQELGKIGINFDQSIVKQQIAGLFAGDSAFTGTTTTPSIATPINFLQSFLPGFVKVITAARKIDELVGIRTVGEWHEQEIVQGILEPTATAAEYGDYTNVPLSSWNTNFERRTIVRGEMGMQVSMLEEARAAAMRVSSAEEKRQSAAIALEQFRNAVGFYGFAGAQGNFTYGFLNDPNLPAFTTVPAGKAGKTTWQDKTFLEITTDIRVAIASLRTQSQDQIDPETTEMTLAIATSKVDYLSTTSDFGISVRDWLNKTYPKIRVVSAPELIGAGTASADVFYLYADRVDSSVDGSTDGGQVFSQLVSSKFMTTGVEKRAKSYIEDYSNATAGVLVARPYGVVRYAGI